MKLTVTVNGTPYEVEVEVAEEPTPTLGLMMAGSSAAVPAPTAPAHVRTPANEEKVLRAPISGTVTKVLASAGDSFQPGETLLVLEAMKMETEITAPAAGTVASVTVESGQAVSGGQVLVEWA
ncbi:MAG: methylmalonyl-CoA carboxyltransferase subunit [Actinomycetota bacterium]|nr:methylmalonyl-CoA carboxyltransferase subunit [Actinomycetota bacterium]